MKEFQIIWSKWGRSSSTGPLLTVLNAKFNNQHKTKIIYINNVDWIALVWFSTQKKFGFWFHERSRIETWEAALWPQLKITVTVRPAQSPRQWLIWSALKSTSSALICSYSFMRDLPHVCEGENPVSQVSFRSCSLELRHRPPGFSLGGGTLCFVSVIKAIGFRVSSLCRSLSNTHGHLDPEILLQAAEKERAVGLKKMSPRPCSAPPGVTLPFFCYTKDFFKCLCDNGL